MAAEKKREGNTAALIYEQIRADILSGKLEPGSPLSQKGIASAAGTSRGPVREALGRLQQDQLVIGKANQRFNVAPFDLEDLEAVHGLHIVNVALGARVSVPFLSADEIKFLRQRSDILAEQAEGDEDAWEGAYREFTLTLIKHAGARTVSLVEVLIDNIERYRRGLLARAPKVSPRGVAFGEIVDAAAKGDAKGAAELFVEYSSRMAMLILAGAAPHHDPVRLRGYVPAMASWK